MSRVCWSVDKMRKFRSRYRLMWVLNGWYVMTRGRNGEIKPLIEYLWSWHTTRLTPTSNGIYSSRKKRTRPISSHLDRTYLVNKRFIIWLLGKFCLRDTAGSPERARWLHLARSGSRSQRAIWFILPARGTSHIIKYNIDSRYYTDFNFTSVFASPCFL